MRILITGGAGCLGSNLIEHWLPKGYKIHVLDNFATGYRETVPQGIANLTLAEGTIANKSFVENEFNAFKPTHVIHAAAAYKDPDDWQEDTQTNILGSIFVADAAKNHAVKRLVNLQTALCFGRPTKTPIPVNHACKPVSSYGLSKKTGEDYVMMAGIPANSLRLASIIAPRLSIGAIPTFYTRMKAGKGVFCSTAVRDYLDIEDFIIFMDKLLDENAPQGVYNLGPGVGHSIVDVLKAVCAYLNLPLPNPLDIRPVGDDDVETVVLGIKDTKKDFNWKPKVSFEQSITKMLKWYDTYGVSAIHSHLKPSAK